MRHFDFDIPPRTWSVETMLPARHRFAVTTTARGPVLTDVVTSPGIPEFRVPDTELTISLGLRAQDVAELCAVLRRWLYLNDPDMYLYATQGRPPL